MNNDQIQDKLNNLADHVIELTGSNKELYKHLNRIADSINRVDTTVEDLQRQLNSMNDLESRIRTLEVNTGSKENRLNLEQRLANLEITTERLRKSDKSLLAGINEIHRSTAVFTDKIRELIVTSSQDTKDVIEFHYGELNEAASELGRQLDKFKKDTNNELHKFAAHIGTDIGELKAHVEDLQSKEKAREQGCTTQSTPHQLSTIGATTGRSECCNSGDRTSEKPTEAVGQSKQETSPYPTSTERLVGVYPPSSFYMAGNPIVYEDLYVYKQDLAKYKKVEKEPYQVVLLDGRRYLTWKLHLRDARDEEYKMTAAVDINKYGYETTGFIHPKALSDAYEDRLHDSIIDEATDKCTFKNVRHNTTLPDPCTNDKQPGPLPNPPQKAKTEKVCPGIEQIPFHSIERIGAIFEEGRIKYGKDNWKKGVGDHEFIEERIRHMLRHVTLFANGDRQEDHLAKVGWGSVALMELIRLGEENGRED